MSAGRKHASHRAGRKGHAASIADAISARVLRALTAAAESESDTKIERDDDACATAVDIDAGLSLETHDEETAAGLLGWWWFDRTKVQAGERGYIDRADWAVARTPSGRVQVRFVGPGDAAARAAKAAAMRARNATGEFATQANGPAANGAFASAAPNASGVGVAANAPAAVAPRDEGVSSSDDEAGAGGTDSDADPMAPTDAVTERVGQITGGYTKDRAVLPDDEAILSPLQSSVEAMLGCTYSKFVPVAVRTQSVSGTNYTFTVEVDRGKIEVTVYKNFDGSPPYVKAAAAEYTPDRTDVTPEELAMLEAVKHGVAALMVPGDTYEEFKPTAVRTQAIGGGENYVFNVDTYASVWGGSPIEVKVFKPRSGDPVLVTAAVAGNKSKRLV